MQLKESFMFKKCCCCCCCLAEKHEFWLKIHGSVLIRRRYKRKNPGKLLTHSRVQIIYIGFEGGCYMSSKYSLILRKIAKNAPACIEERSLLLIQTIEVSLTQLLLWYQLYWACGHEKTANNPEFVQENKRVSETCHVAIAILPVQQKHSS